MLILRIFLYLAKFLYKDHKDHFTFFIEGLELNCNSEDCILYDS